MKVRENWTEQHVKQALDRVARMVSHDQNEAIRQSDGYEYALDQSGNSWWGKFDRESRELVVAYRYAVAAKMEAFEVFLRWQLGLEEE